MKGISKEVDGLYYFSNHFSHDGPDNVGDKVMITKTGGTNGMVWHNRLGHPSVKVLRQLSLVEKESDVRMCNNCHVCPLAKQTKLPFPISISQTSNVFDLIHLDVWGPYRFATHNGF